MADKTGIEWTDSTWNPIRGCSRVSEGCRNCYAEGVARRFSGPGLPYEGLVRIGGDGKPHEWNGNIAFAKNHLLDPLRWKRIELAPAEPPHGTIWRPRRIFVNSMSDLFHENVTDELRDRIFAVMALCPQHTFQVLTKRPERMLTYLAERPQAVWHRKALDIDLNALPMLTAQPWPLPNVWLGVSVENQKAADERIPLLLQAPAAVRFLSCEPLLGPVNLRRIDWVEPMKARITRYLNESKGSEHEPMFREMQQSIASCDWSEGRAWRDVLTGAWFDGWDGDDAPEPSHDCIDWVIAGGESGRGARPMHPDWPRSLRDQCAAAGVPFFFKQWGEWTPGVNVERNTGKVRGAWLENSRWRYSLENLADDEGHIDDGPELYRVGKKAAGHLLDGVEHHAFPAVCA